MPSKCQRTQQLKTVTKLHQSDLLIMARANLHLKAYPVWESTVTTRCYGTHVFGAKLLPGIPFVWDVFCSV